MTASNGPDSQPTMLDFEPSQQGQHRGQPDPDERADEAVDYTPRHLSRHPWWRYFAKR